MIGLRDMIQQQQNRHVVKSQQNCKAVQDQVLELYSQNTPGKASADGDANSGNPSESDEPISSLNKSVILSY
jgi:hypothetical protein